MWRFEPFSIHLEMTQDRYAATNGVCADNPVQCTGVRLLEPT